METDVKDSELHNNRNGRNERKTSSVQFIDTLNNNINHLLDKIDEEQNSLPSPKAMLETIMPCEKLCNSFRHITDEGDESDGDDRHVMMLTKTKFKSELEPTVVCDGDGMDDGVPLNLKSQRHVSNLMSQTQSFF